MEKILPFVFYAVKPLILCGFQPSNFLLLDRLFRIYAAFCLFQTIFRQVSQYLPRLLRLMKSIPQTTHLAVFFGFVSKIYNSLSSGRTAVLNHLQIICE